jgi:ADP-ribosylglycohydrolase
MRVSPLAVFGWSNPDRAVLWAREDSGLTHPNPVCRESCAAFVRAITAALTGGDALECYRAALNEAQRGGESGVVSALQTAAKNPPEEMDTKTVGWVLLALQNAFYRLLHSKSFEEALVETVGCGGDTDTNAAICGALLGALHGRDAIPARWRRKVLTCRPIAEVQAMHPRPVYFWPVDAYELSEALLVAGAEVTNG